MGEHYVPPRTAIARPQGADMAETEQDTPTTPPPPSFGTRARRFFVTLGIAGLAGLVGAGGMWVRQSTATRELQRQVEGADAACDTRIAIVNAERDVARRNASRLLAFLDVTGARTELTRGNFGNARTRVEAATAHLRDGGDVELALRLERLDIQVTEDLETPQTELTAIGKAIEASIDDPNPSGTP